MMLQKRPSLSSYVADLQSAGRITFTRKEALAALGGTANAFLKAAERLQSQHLLFNPRHGFYVVVQPQYRSWGAPPPASYIDDLMKHEEAPYYVGLLKAAELHGASHQAVMEFQVVTNKRMPKIRAGRSIIAFLYRKDMAPIADGLARQQTDTGTMSLSAPELTALDIVRYAGAAGTIDSIATVLSDLGAKMKPERLAKLAPAFERTVIQRLGYLLDHLKFKKCADALEAYLRTLKPLPWIELEPSLHRAKSKQPLERNSRWNVIVRHRPEIDE